MNYANGLVFGTDAQSKHLYVTGPYAGKVIVKSYGVVGTDGQPVLQAPAVSNSSLGRRPPVVR